MSFLNSLISFFENLIQYVYFSYHSIIYGFLFLILGFILAKLVSWAVYTFLVRIEVDRLIETLKIKEALFNIDLINLTRIFVFIQIFLIYIYFSFRMFGISILEQIISKITFEIFPKFVILVIYLFLVLWISYILKLKFKSLEFRYASEFSDLFYILFNISCVILLLHEFGIIEGQFFIELFKYFCYGLAFGTASSIILFSVLGIMKKS